MGSSVGDVRLQWKNSSESNIKLVCGLLEEQIGSQQQRSNNSRIKDLALKNLTAGAISREAPHIHFVFPNLQKLRKL